MEFIYPAYLSRQILEGADYEKNTTTILNAS